MLKKIFFCLSVSFCFQVTMGRGGELAWAKQQKKQEIKQEIKQRKNQTKAKQGAKPSSTLTSSDSPSAQENYSFEELMGFRQFLKKYRESGQLRWHFGFGLEHAPDFYVPGPAYSDNLIKGDAVTYDDLNNNNYFTKKIGRVLTIPIALEFQSAISSQMERLKWLFQAGVKISYWVSIKHTDFHTLSLLGLRYYFNKPTTDIYHYFIGFSAGPADLSDFKIKAIQGSFLFGFGSGSIDMEWSFSPIYYFEREGFNYNSSVIFSFPIKKWWSKRSDSIEEYDPED